MKRITKKWVFSVAGFLLLTSPAYGFSMEEAMTNSEGQVLSQLTTFVGDRTYDDAELETQLESASFRSPLSILSMPDGTYLVSDSQNHVIRHIVGDKINIFAGYPWLNKNTSGMPQGALLDGDQGEAVFQQPAGLAMDAAGNVYVADAGNHAIRKINREGQVTTIAGNGVAGFRDGKGSEARFHTPMGVVATADGTLYVADTGNHVIRVIDRDGKVSTLNARSERMVELVPGIVEQAGDYQDGDLSEAMFNEPYALALDKMGNLYVSDAGNQLIRYIDLQAGSVNTVAGMIRTPFYEQDALYAAGGYSDGSALEAAFNSPKGLALNEDGSLIIADSMNHSIRMLRDGQVFTLAGSNAAYHGSDDGINGESTLHNPTDITVTAGGFLIADTNNQTIRQFELLTLPEEAIANERVDVLLSGQLLNLEHEAIIREGRTFLAINELAEVLQLEYHTTNGVTNIILENGKEYAFRDGEKTIDFISEGWTSQIEMDVAPFIEKDTMYIPLRFLAEALGLHVDWHASSKSVILR